jgi:ferredoxin
VKVRVDVDLCQGHGACVEEAPAVFSLDDATHQVVILKEPTSQSAPP